MLSFAAFLNAHTRIVAPAACPEIRLHLADDMEALWERQQSCLPGHGATPPYWSVAWVGGQALARYALDNPSRFRHQSILDFGAGSGLCAIAAAKAGATVQASDIDPLSIEAIACNARLNNVRVEPLHEDVIGTRSRWSMVFAADVWYDAHLARRLTSWLRQIAGEGTKVLLGDRGRTYFPHRGITELQRYDIPAPESLEQQSVSSTAVWALGRTDHAWRNCDASAANSDPLAMHTYLAGQACLGRPSD